MKNPKHKMKTPISLALALNASFALAATSSLPAPRAGNEGPNGGDGVRPVSGSPSLADPYLKIERKPVELGGKRFELSEKLKAELQKIYKIGNAYGFSAYEMNERTFGEGVKYYFTEEFGDARCRNRAQYQIPDHTQFIGTIGCTWLNKTWVKESVFQEMSVTDQALLIVHERLRAKSSSPTLNYIADVTNGLRAARAAYARQAGGDLSALDSDTLEKLSLLALASPVVLDGQNEAEITDRVFTRQGGVVLKDAAVQPGAVIGVGSIIGKKVWVGNGAVILNTNLEALYGDVGISTRSPESPLWGERKQFYRIEEGARLRDADLSETSLIQIGRNVTITGSKLGGCVRDSQGEREVRAAIAIEDGASVRNSEVMGAVIRLEKNAKISSSKLENYFGVIHLGTNSDISNVRFDHQKTQFPNPYGGVYGFGASFAEILELAQGASLRNLNFALADLHRVGRFIGTKGWALDERFPMTSASAEGDDYSAYLNTGFGGMQAWIQLPPSPRSFELGAGVQLDGQGRDLCPNDFAIGGDLLRAGSYKKPSDLARICFDNQGLPFVPAKE